MRRPRALLLLPLLLLLLAAGRLAADGDGDDALPRERRWVEVPDLRGKPEAEALQTLRNLGFQPNVVTVAEGCANVVTDQRPDPGVAVERGREVLLKVCVPVTVVTKAPDVVGRLEGDVLPALEPVYYVEKRYVLGRPETPGTVLAQEPAAGADLPYRGVLRLRIAARPVRLPTVLGLPVDEAVGLLEAEGLEVDVVHTEDDVEVPGTVIAQLPGQGTDVVPGSTVTLRVAGSPEQAPSTTPSVAVPPLLGLDMEAAYRALDEVGLVPYSTFLETAPPGLPDEPWHVVDQAPEAGTMLAPGSEVSVGILRPRADVPTLRTPNLFGLAQADAEHILASVGLRARVLPAISALPPGIVVRQAPEPGETIARGADVEIVVTVRPTSTTTRYVLVPNLLGAPIVDARRTLLARGLDVRVLYRIAPDRTPREVAGQSPRAGTRVPSGATITLVIPAEGRVPPVQGLTPQEATAAIEAAGFTAEGVGPLVAGPAYVVRQTPAPDTLLARGSRVQFTFAAAGGGALVRVPHVTGLRVEAALQELAAAGLDAQVSGPPFGQALRTVVSQTPGAGTRLPRGTKVHLQTAWVGGGTPPATGGRVTVPTIVGLGPAEARAALAAQGLVLEATGPAVGIGTPRVVRQDPPPGRRVAPGSRVKATFAWGLGPTTAPRLAVPDVVGQPLEVAQQALVARGLRVRVAGEQAGRPNAVVRAQDPRPGTIVASATVVTIAVVYEDTPSTVGVPVPDVVGLDARVAAQRLVAAGLQVRLVPSGTLGVQVLDQSPRGGVVARGTTVTLLIGAAR